MMKIVVLAHTPPPFHGQSCMVQILLDCARDSRELPRPEADPPAGTVQPVVSAPQLELIHVDFRLSESIEDIGRRPWTKLALALKYCALAVRARFRLGAHTLLYIPAPALRNAIYRDWLVMICCRPFFRRRIFWWHAAGLGPWLAQNARPWERWISRRLLGHPDLSIVLGSATESDARALGSRRIGVVPNGIPDPCPHDVAELLRERAARRTRQRELLSSSALGAQSTAPEPRFALFRLLFLSLCYREKGMFDAADAVACLNQRLAARDVRIRVQLDVAGRFYLDREHKEFEERIGREDLRLNLGLSGESGAECSSRPAVRYHGFTTGEAKERLFRECDLLVFPTYYEAESYPLVLLEAMAYGMDVVTTHWRNIPELLPADYPGLVHPKDPVGIANALEHFLTRYEGARLRRRYEQYHSTPQFWSRIRSAVLALETALEPESSAQTEA